MRFIRLIFCFTFFISNSQTILNTESIMSKIDEDYIFGLDLSGSVETGNVEIAEINFSAQIGKKIDNSLFRFIIGYEYESESKEIISQDYSGQIRYNYLLGKDSFFSFIQSQSIKSIFMDHRNLFGIGYRKNLFNKKNNNLDFSLGIFYEDELYNKSVNPIEVYNYRYSFSSFSNLNFSENLRLNSNLYYQINTSNTNDYRLFIEPKLYFDFSDNTSFYLSTRHRYHSTPYMPVKKNDTETTIGIEIIL